MTDISPSSISVEGVLDMLAHRFPFLLLDRIIELEPGKRAVGEKRITGGDWFLHEGSLAEAPMPHVLVLEALAQASGAVLLHLGGENGAVVGYFAGIDRVKFRREARAGDTLRLEVELRRYRRNIAKLAGLATVDGARIVSAEFTVAIRGAGAGV